MKNRFTQASTGSLQLQAIPAFNDNYIWLLHNGQHAVVVDPGDASPVLEVLTTQQLTLSAILITHHHHDHVGGITALLDVFPTIDVYGPAKENIPHCTQKLNEASAVKLNALGLDLRVLDIPGHTAGHIAYFGYSDLNEAFVFCGDTLFSGGCGRLFEGTPAQMLNSLNKLSALPPETLICCAHEYTLSNLMWALDVEPDNAELQAYFNEANQLRAAGQPTLPSTLAREQKINPFLRTHIPAVQSSAAQHSSHPLHNATDVFAQLRLWKNNA